MEELRLNSRLAPELYLDCVPIGGSPEQPRPGITPAIEYAVRMRRFAQTAPLTGCWPPGNWKHATSTPRPAGWRRFIAALPSPVPNCRLAPRNGCASPCWTTLPTSGPRLTDPAGREQLHALENWTLAATERLWPRLAERKAGGWIRECHGDLHLGNLLLSDDDQITIFDGIEFNDELRWIDSSTTAFLLMDLRCHGAGALAQRLLNIYLEYSGDFSGVALLSCYQVYRAMVRRCQRNPGQLFRLPHVERLVGSTSIRCGGQALFPGLAFACRSGAGGGLHLVDD